MLVEVAWQQGSRPRPCSAGLHVAADRAERRTPC
jgi:hypothetical protein